MKVSCIPTLIIGVVLSIVFGVVEIAKATPIISFQKLVGTNTLIPESIYSFTGFGRVSIDNGDIAFKGGGDPVGNTISKIVDGSLSLLVSSNTQIPGQTENFGSLSLGLPSIDNGNVALGTPKGVYTDLSGTLGRVADQNTSMPGGGTFNSFNNAIISGEDIAFRGGDFPSGNIGIYISNNGSLELVADRNTPIPGAETENFDSLGLNSFSQGTASFMGEGSTSPRNSYTNAGGSLSTLIDLNTPILIPDGTGDFESINHVYISEQDVAFEGWGSSGQRGFYTSINDSLDMVADLNTSIPDGIGNFHSFGEMSFDNGNMAFFAMNSNSQRGIYTNWGGTLTKVIAEGDILDGSSVYNILFSTEGLSENQIAFSLPWKGIFVATLTQDSEPPPITDPIPEPSTILLLTAGIAGMGAYRFRRKKRKT